MKNEIKNIEASVRDRLKNKAKERHCPFSEILQYYGMERFFYRFSKSGYKDKFVLKGPLMFTAWDVPERRITLDIDFLAIYSNQISDIEKIIKETCEMKVVSDGLIFDPKTVIGERIKVDADYEGVCIKFVGLLERSRIPMQIDIGFGDVVYPSPKVVHYPTILDFPSPQLKGYPLESIVSEKFETMVKLGPVNSRMKDFYDIWLLIRQLDFDGETLAESLKRTFQQRKTSLPKKKPLFAEEIYDESSDRQMLWKVFLKKGVIQHAPDKLSSAAKAIEKFLVKPLMAIDKEQEFNLKWNAPGPWE